jgi:hypothetical protein
MGWSDLTSPGDPDRGFARKGRATDSFLILARFLLCPLAMVANHYTDPRRTSARLPVRSYSMTWLLRAACRVYERERAQHAEHHHICRRQGVNALFDLSDIPATPLRTQAGA